MLLLMLLGILSILSLVLMALLFAVGTHIAQNGDGA
jgi:hypothetical protein